MFDQARATQPSGILIKPQCKFVGFFPMRNRLYEFHAFFSRNHFPNHQGGRAVFLSSPRAFSTSFFPARMTIPMPMFKER